MAQVPGRCLSSNQTPKEENRPVNCQPCATGGKTFPAKSYCEDCKENLCQACCNYHSALKVLRNHRLSDISATQIKPKEQLGSRPTINCKLHTDELVKFYCRKHNITACAICAVKQHGHCDPDYIQDISFEFMKSEQFKDFLYDLNSLSIQIESFIQLIEDNDKKTTENGQQLVDVLEHRRDEMVQFIHKAIDDLKSELKKCLKRDQNKFSELKKDFTMYKKELNDSKAYISKLKGQGSDLLITCTDTMTRLKGIQDDLKNAESSNITYTYSFKASDPSKNLLSSKNGVGTIIRTTRIQHKQQPLAEEQVITPPDNAKSINWATCKAVSLPDINVKSTQDQNTCGITGIAILGPDVLLISDYDNQSIKRVNTSTTAVTRCIKFPSGPWDITLLEPDLAATTLPDRQRIHFFPVSGDKSLRHDIKVSGTCFGLSSTAAYRLVVGYQNPGKVEIMDKRGAVLSEFRTGVDGQPLFRFPNYICVVKEGLQEVQYVTDAGACTLTKLSLTGQVIFTFKDKGMKCPTGVTATGDGEGVILCGSHNGQVVSGKGEALREILTEKDGVKNSQSISYDASRKIVYVGLWREDKMKVYQMK